jgi:hypothetical protein
MLKDYNDTFVGEGLYTHARNAVNNSHDGQMGVIGNEPSNLSCVTLPYDLIGCIHLFDDQWVVYTTDDTNSEIGIFDESACTYKKLINDPCLGFKRSHLITGASRKRYDCERLVYWADGLNPDRSMDVDNVQQYYNYTDTIVNDCRVRTYLPTINCETLRLSPLVKHPCIDIQKGKLAGTLPNGSYQACIAYTVNQLKVTDYIGLTPVQGLFTHENVSSSLVINITEIDKSFDEFELVILANINAQTVARRIGFYNTSQGIIYVDRWDTEFPVVNVGDVVFRSEPIEKTDAIYPTNDYLLKIGTHSKFKFNYQPLANQIRSSWVAVQYSADYYIRGGNKTGYMRDEVYPFFIRWVYNTGEFSESYHIPGRASIPSERVFIANDDVYETEIRQVWQVQNTGTVGPDPTVTAPSYLNGGVIIGQGGMSYWESTEKYPDNKADIWGDLCGKNIRHHKFPDETISSATTNPLSIFGTDGKTITILGVQFDNIQPPIDNAGKLIPGIVGYEILRGSREGNKSIIAKGLFNNMRTFDTGNNSIPQPAGLFQNYPYNDLRTDPYLTAQGYRKDIFSFHSPDVTFSNPFLNEGEVKLYQEFTGTSSGTFQQCYKHPRFKLASALVKIVSDIVGYMEAAEIVQSLGDLGGGTSGIKVEFTGTENSPISFSYEIPPFPSAPSSAGGEISGPIEALLAWTYFVASVAGWAATVAAIVALAGQLTLSKKQKVFDLLMYLASRVQFAIQYNSHGFYNNYSPNPINNRRRKVLDSIYAGNSLQQFAGTSLIQNIQRSKAVIVQISKDINPTANDNSRFLLGNGSLNTNYSAKIASYYGALKIPIPSQYGQLESIKQIPISTCIVNTTSTNVLFGGDVYITRFTEKNTMPFFTTWLMGEPDEYEFNYQYYYNIPDPKYWVNNFAYKVEFFGNPLSNYRSLDNKTEGVFGINGGYFYLFCNGVRDFFVESEVNVAYRDWEDDIPHRHYDSLRFTDLSSMFRSDIATSGNYYKYDYNLSASKLFNSSVSWGNLLPRDYNPLTYASCYTYRPNRVIYSLPQQSGSKKDSWKLFLTNNYKDFPSRVSCIKPINKTGSLFMMAYQGPLSFMGVEELKMDGTGAKITIGDGGLFQQALQSITNVDESFEYGSNQGRYCSINTVHGVFWISQNQGKVFLFAGQLKEISASEGMRWWFAKYLPSELLKAFPDYPLYDNPVIGVGVQMMYDNTNDVLYITKKDYKPLRNDLAYDDKGFYYISGTTNTTIPGTTTYTCDNGFTLSGTTCTGIELIPAIKSTSISFVAGKISGAYYNGKRGAYIYNTYNVNGTSSSFITIPITPTNNTVWNSDNNPLFGRLNNVGFWKQNDISYLTTPVGLTFTFSLNIPSGSKSYYVGIGVDNYAEVIVNCNTILQMDPAAMDINHGGVYGVPYEGWHIYKITLNNGVNYVTIKGINLGGPGALGYEIYDATDTQLINVPSVTQLENLIAKDSITGLPITSKNLFGKTLDSINYNCDCGSVVVRGTASNPTYWCPTTVSKPATSDTTPSTTIKVPIKTYCNFNSACWEDASFTVSYDCKSEKWISFHDWHPTFLIPGRSHFMSVNYNSIWKHNITCTSYCNFYGIDYPFEIEFVSATGQTVNSMRSIEYLLEVYNYFRDCRDKFHVLDQNFDQAIIYNSEQVSGVLQLNIKPKNNPVAALGYPIIRNSPDYIDILFSKEENKYRFDQFWDITKDRGEYTGVKFPMFNTQANGYMYPINPTYVNYNKPVLQRKKFRHNVNKIFLRKVKSGNNKFLFKISNQKLLQSPR